MITTTWEKSSTYVYTYIHIWCYAIVFILKNLVRLSAECYIKQMIINTFYVEICIPFYNIFYLLYKEKYQSLQYKQETLY